MQYVSNICQREPTDDAICTCIFGRGFSSSPEGAASTLAGDTRRGEAREDGRGEANRSHIAWLKHERIY